MTLEEKVRADLLLASKGNDALARETLRGLLSAAHNELIQKRSSEEKKETLSDEEFLSVVLREAKKRRESIDVFEKAGRMELAEKEKKELEILKVYLPPQMDEEEIISEIQKIVEELSPSGPQDFGKVMGSLMGKLRGKADAVVVGKLLKQRLENLD